MSGTLVDTDVLLDVFTDDPEWGDWSQAALEDRAARGPVYINPVIYAEVSMGFEQIESVEEALGGCGLTMLSLPKEALFLAGKVFLRYRSQGGRRRVPLPDFFIGAHAAVTGLTLVTRDRDRFGCYFPKLRVVGP